MLKGGGPTVVSWATKSETIQYFIFKLKPKK